MPLPSTLTATRLPEEDRKALRQLAEENDRTISGELRRAVRFYLASQKPKEA